MNRFIKKPHFVFIIFISLLIPIGVLFENKSIDINIHDTMYVISLYFLSVIIAGLFVIVSLCYWLSDKLGLKLSYWLNLLHILLTIGFLIGLIYYLIINNNFEYLLHIHKIQTISVILLIVGLLIFLINVFISIWNRFVKPLANNGYN